MFHKVKRAAQESEQLDINPFSMIATAKLIVSSKSFNDKLKAFKKTNKKTEFTPEEMLQIYSEHLNSKREGN